MPIPGILRTWHDDRGFGFIAPTHGGPEIFVHISAFPADGTRPVAGESLTYELGRGKDGKPAAVRVIRKAIGEELVPRSAAAGNAPGATRPTHATTPRVGKHKQKRSLPSTLLSALMSLIFLVLIGTAIKDRYGHRIPADLGPPALPGSKVDKPGCDGRLYCSQMRSCAEAKWFLQNCPGTQMDGDRDGIPCEDQWCTSLLAP